MRYDELTLPLGTGVLHLTFHPRCTVLAGLTRSRRHDLIEAIARLNRGDIPGGSVSLVDLADRRLRIDAASDDAATDGEPARRSVGEWCSLLAVGPEDLTLPGLAEAGGRDRDPEALEAERRAEARLVTEIAAARDARRRHAAAEAELRSCEEALADMGAAADRHRQDRARTLIELEQLRASFAALDAPPGQVARDERLITVTDRIERLGTEWADLGTRLDGLRAAFGERERFDDATVLRLAEVPDRIPEVVTATIAERDRLQRALDEQRDALAHLGDDTGVATPDDPRVLALAALDQEYLWLTHRDVLLATEALHDAQRREQERLGADPDAHERVVRAHTEVAAATERTERRWMPTVLAATATACAAAVAVITDTWTSLVPVALVVCVAVLVFGVAIPRLALRRAVKREAKALEALDANDITEYLARFDEHPGTEHWRRAEAAIEDYRNTRTEWQALAGAITPEEATELEEAVDDWIGRTDPQRRDRATRRAERRIDRTAGELDDVTRRLGALLEPFGCDAADPTVADTLRDRVDDARFARIQMALDDAVEAEAKLTDRLGVELAALGFEAGSLSTRIAAYGRELDSAVQRDKLRRAAPDRAALEARAARLRLHLSVPEGADPNRVVVGDADHDPVVDVLRQRRTILTERVAGFVDPDLEGLEKQRRQVAARIADLEGEPARDLDRVVSDAVDHVVQTLVRYRPVWPTTGSEPAPALLDDPFAELSFEGKDVLLDAVVEVSRVVQIVLLTDDPGTVEWAVERERRGVLTLVAPAAVRQSSSRSSARNRADRST